MKREANPIQRQQERELEKIEICTEIWKGAKEELYLSMRFFDVILNRMDCVQNPHMRGVGTDGLAVYYETDAVLSMYKSNRLLAFAFSDSSKYIRHGGRSILESCMRYHCGIYAGLPELQKCEEVCAATA